MGPCLSSFHIWKLGSDGTKLTLSSSDPLQTDPAVNLSLIQIARVFFSCSVFEASYLLL